LSRPNLALDPSITVIKAAIVITNISGIKAIINIIIKTILHTIDIEVIKAIMDTTTSKT
jgi:hypothetical protein